MSIHCIISLLQVYGDGKQTRSFAYVSDLVDGLVALMESNYTQPVNLGNPEEHTIIDFARIIKGVIGKIPQTPHPMGVLCWRLH